MFSKGTKFPFKSFLSNFLGEKFAGAGQRPANKNIVLLKH